MVFLGEKLIHKSMWESSMRLGWISQVNFLIKFLSKDMDVSQMIFTWVSNDFFHPNSFQRTFKRTKECWKDFDQNMNVKYYIQFSSTWHVNSIWCWKNYIQDISAGLVYDQATPSRCRETNSQSTFWSSWISRLKKYWEVNSKIKGYITVLFTVYF